MNADQVMGSEAQCTVQFGKQRSEGTARLETDHVLFRGAFRLKIPHKAITKLDADRTTLRVTFPDTVYGNVTRTPTWPGASTVGSTAIS